MSNHVLVMQADHRSFLLTLIILGVLLYLLLVEHSREVTSGVECLSWKDEKVKPERFEKGRAKG